jgi:thiol:disulfide interchange protein DsbC
MKTLAFALCTLLLAGAAQAQQVDQETEKKIRNSLSILLPGLLPDEIRPTPVDDLYEVTFGARIAYITADGRYLIQGKMIDLETRTEITEKRMSELKMAALAEVGEDQMIIYGPADAKDTVTVFTDIDCGFCRKLHSEMARYNEEGIRIRYLFYPRAGIGSDSYNKAVSVWCADDRKKAMDVAKAGGDIPGKTCENPVDEHYELGQTMRLSGTPALMLEGGEMVPGYVPAHKLRKALDERRAQSAN